jgi:hypothetical protein
MLERNPDARYVYFPEPNDRSTWIEVGKNMVDEEGEPGWQTVLNTRGRRAGASKETAQNLQRAMTNRPRVSFAEGETQRQTSIAEHFPGRTVPLRGILRNTTPGQGAAPAASSSASAQNTPVTFHE